MAFTWKIQSDCGDYTLKGTGSLGNNATSISKELPCLPFGSVQVLVTAGTLRCQITSSNDGTNFSAGYSDINASNLLGTVRPPLFTALAASKNFDYPGFGAYKKNRLELTAGAGGFTGTVIIFLTRRAE